MKRLIITAVAALCAAGSAQAQMGPRPNPDLDRDGRVTLAEFRKSHADGMLARFDANKDGKLVRSELKPLAGMTPPAGGPGFSGAPTGSIQAAWRGFGGDEISAGVSGQPDGQPDGAITLQFPGERRMLKRIDIYAVDERGQRTSTHWSSWDGVHWLMALRAREVRLNPRGPVDSLGLPAQTLTALVTNDGSLKPGQRLEVEATFTDGSTAKGYLVVTP